MTASSDLPVPEAIRSLIESGFWPTAKEADLQNLKPLVPADKVKVFAPEEVRIYFYPPPFHTISWRRLHGEKFWDSPMGALHEVDPDLTVVIGDFGIGSDTALALDYRRKISDPSLIRLKWDGRETHWVEVAPTADMFAQMIHS